MFPSIDLGNLAGGVVRDYAERAKASALGALAGAVPGLGSLISSKSIEFPDELQEIDHSVTFSAYETKQAMRLDTEKEKLLASIALPIPGNLQTAYNISYTETSLGALGYEFMTALGGGKEGQQSLNFLSKYAQAIGTGTLVGGAAGALTGGSIGGSALTGGMGGMTAQVISELVSGTTTSQTGLQVGASTLIGTDPLAAAAAAQFGVARNPHKVVLFESVGFRKHSFSYQFTPKNRGESERLKRLIYLFKYHASPGLGSKKEGGAEVTIQTAKINALFGTQMNNISIAGGKHFFKYPEFFKIQFKHPHFLFQIGNSFLTSVDVNYQPAGAPTYARDSHHDKPAPTQINLSLTFTETDIVTKSNIDTGR